MGKKTLADFEQTHGGGRIKTLQATINALARKRRDITLEVPSADNSLRFGLIGDTQFGNLYEAKDVLAALYRRFQAEGITTVLHAGDVLDGHKVYKGQEFELHALGWEKQSAWFADAAPRVPGVTTHFITGNHDASLKHAAGINVGKELEQIRPDWHFLGEDYGLVTLKTRKGKPYRVALLHPGGGSSYAISYRAQKIVEQLEGGTKPDLLGIGHFHKADFLPAYRNVSVIQVGCCEWQTPFMVRGGLAAHVGGWIVRVTPGDFNNAVSAEFIAFYAKP